MASPPDGFVCPVCAGTEWEPIDPDDESFEHLRCVVCDCFRIGREAAPAAPYDTYYSPESAQRLSGVFQLAWVLRRRVRARLIGRHSPSGSRICDVGCERGELLNALKTLGHRVTGTQLSRSAVEFAARRFGIDVFLGELHDARFEPASFDAVLMMNVLEHLEQPASYLAEVNRILRPDGLLWLELPNTASFTATACGKRWLHHDPDHHRWAFSITNLSTMLENHGFHVERVYHLNLEHGPIGCLQSWLNYLPGPRNVLFDIVRRGYSRAPGRLLMELVHTVIGTVALPAAITMSGLESAMKNGQVVLLRVRKTL